MNFQKARNLLSAYVPGVWHVPQDMISTCEACALERVVPFRFSQQGPVSTAFLLG